MKRVSTPANRFAAYLIVTVLAGVPFFGLLTVWGSTLVGHYAVLRLWDDVLLLVLLGIVCWWLLKDRELLTWFTHSLLVRLIFAYAALSLLLGFIALTKGEVTGKALAYGLLVNLRFLVWFLAVLLTARRAPFLRQYWPRLLLVPAAVVVVFAVLQFAVLPHNFLSHFGYNAATTIAPIETINHNARYIRVQSTLRGANPLGAYLVIILSALGVLFLYGRRKLVCLTFGIVALAALFASGSRSAWIGTALSFFTIAWLRLETLRGRVLLGAVGLAVVILALGGYLLLKNNVSLQNEILHTQPHSAVTITSNGAHANATENGIKDVINQPLGDGPGTAGPASIYNGKHPARIAENYYVQVAQETGWIGMALFLSIIVLVAIELYEQSSASRLALIMFAGFIGVAFVNLLSHAWADDTLAYVWWGFAAIALAALPEHKDAS